MTATHTEIVQATRNLHHEVSNALLRQPQDIFDNFDNATPFDACAHMLDHDAYTGDDAVDELVSSTQGLARSFLSLIVAQHRLSITYFR
jgi:hypothetical protein